MNDQIILILASNQPDVLGDLDLYRNTSTAERALEVIDVKNNKYFGFTLDGKRLALTADKNAIQITPANDSRNYSSTVRDLLEGQAALVVRNRKIGLMNIALMTLTELVDLIGFSK